jgi:hypothetical protein
MALPAVAHPVNLFPSNDPNAPQIVDARDDQLGTTAQDIRQGRFAYDVATNQIVYTLTLADLSVTTPNMRGTMTSKFGATDVFVTASLNETDTTFKYGKVTLLATGTRNQQTLGDADSGELRGNQLIIRLALDKINTAVGVNVAGTTSTGIQAQAQIIVGSSLTGGLLLSSDTATGSDFTINNQQNPDPTPSPTVTPTPSPTVTPSATPTPMQESTPTPEPSPNASPTPEPTPVPSETGKFDERYSGTMNVGQSVMEIAFTIRRSTLDAQINQNYGNQSLVLELLDGNHNLIVTAAKDRITLNRLTNGTYFYRIRGEVSRAVDFTIKSVQGK